MITLDPISDRRWRELIDRHPAASVFHTPEWLQALLATYGFKPAANATATSGVVFCRVPRPFAGERLVSLPFSDHCDPLISDPSELEHLLPATIEIRPTTQHSVPNLTAGPKFWHHKLDLQSRNPFDRFHPDCVQRKIRRAERENLMIEQGRTESLVERFYRLQVGTRRRHGLPPQPRAWFRNLVASMGEMLTISIASTNNQPVAAILTLQFKDTMTYKYGCSDRRFSHLGGMQLLLWNAIRKALQQGLSTLDMGRSDWDNEGLVAFKDRWGASRSVLQYWQSGSAPGAPDWTRNAARFIFGHLPASLAPWTGKLLYRHFGSLRA